MEVWGDTSLSVPFLAEREAFTNVYTGNTVSPADSGLELADLLSTFPAALLFRELPDIAT